MRLFEIAFNENAENLDAISCVHYALQSVLVRLRYITTSNIAIELLIDKPFDCDIWRDDKRSINIKCGIARDRLEGSSIEVAEYFSFIVERCLLELWDKKGWSKSDISDAFENLRKNEYITTVIVKKISAKECGLIAQIQAEVHPGFSRSFIGFRKHKSQFEFVEFFRGEPDFSLFLDRLYLVDWHLCERLRLYFFYDRIHFEFDLASPGDFTVHKVDVLTQPVEYYLQMFKRGCTTEDRLRLYREIAMA
jgi:hypothetical protein